MSDPINIDDIYDKNINFLFGSGASFGLFPTLALNIKGPNQEQQTIETLGKHLETPDSKSLHTLLFMHYYKNCIEPVMSFDIDQMTEVGSKKVIENYEIFLKNILIILNRKEQTARRCNIFTTNYDSCFEATADRLLRKERQNFILNDGSMGFQKRILHSRNFNSVVYQTGIFEQHRAYIPQINLIHLHGSIFWKKSESANEIEVSYYRKHLENIISQKQLDLLTNFSTLINQSTKKIEDLNSLKSKRLDGSAFWNKYNEIPIVNPTKWKFHETVFDEHYYQMLRFLSYELEKPNSVLLTFGFSFADEHIKNLLLRSISNPTLQVFICCFDQKEEQQMKDSFKEFKNVKLITSQSNLDFTTFNNEKFTLANKG
jgi:hypothetical protein